MTDKGIGWRQRLMQAGASRSFYIQVQLGCGRWRRVRWKLWGRSGELHVRRCSLRRSLWGAGAGVLVGVTWGLYASISRYIWISCCSVCVCCEARGRNAGVLKCVGRVSVYWTWIVELGGSTANSHKELDQLFWITAGTTGTIYTA